MAPVTAAQFTDRAAGLFIEHQQRIFARTDRMFAGLMVLQWIAGVVAAIWIAPKTWTGPLSETHPHVWAALLLGGLITTLPVALALRRPGETSTRYVIAVAQMLWSSLLIHLTGGRIETHFHVFGSLAFLAFYRDWRVLIPATIVVALDHFLRGVFWPQSVFGVLVTSPWRWVEHAAWVAFEDVFLIHSCVQSVDEMREIARQRAALEAVNEQIERTVLIRTAELRASQEKFRQAFTSAPIGMALVAPDGRWLQVNRALCEMVGYSERELINITFQAITHPDDLLDSTEALEQLRADGRTVVQLEKRYLHKNGDVVWISVSSSAVRDAGGRVLYQIAQIQDITQGKRARIELEEAKEAAEAASCAKSEFLATMSHELRTPLNIILGYTGLLRDFEFGPLTPDQDVALERVHTGAAELLELIEATLDLGRLEAGRVSVTPEWVSLEALLREIDTETFDLQQKPGIDVVWQIASGLPSIHTDPHKLKIVIKNLLGNAIKFTDVGEVVVAAKQRDGDFVLIVSDTGIGIPREALSIIFEPFRQGDGSPTRRHGGVGLGLYIVTRLLELLGGSLSVDSKVDRGSIFVVRLPAQAGDHHTRDPYTFNTGSAAAQSLHRPFARFLENPSNGSSAGT